jgi:hypothetical protein
MKRRKKQGRNLNFSVGILIVIGILVFLLASCESIFGPKTEASTSDETEEARIIIDNESGESLDIYMDGSFQFLIEDGDSKKIHNVSLGNEHKLEAKIPGTATVYDSETIDVTAYTDYTWTIGDLPDIKVTNKYGKTLKIYMDGNYQFNLVDDEDRWIMNVPYGEHFLKALKDSDNKEVASTTIDVNANKDYSWVIQ